MDHSLGTDVEDCGDPPVVKGVPIHHGQCSDGVFGCKHCLMALKRMNPEERKAYVAEFSDSGIASEEDMVFTFTTSCDWCHKSVDISDSRQIRPWDEPSCEYQVCRACVAEENKSIREEDEYDQRSRDEDDDR